MKVGAVGGIAIGNGKSGILKTLEVNVVVVVVVVVVVNVVIVVKEEGDTGAVGFEIDIFVGENPLLKSLINFFHFGKSSLSDSQTFSCPVQLTQYC